MNKEIEFLRNLVTPMVIFYIGLYSFLNKIQDEKNSNMDKFHINLDTIVRKHTSDFIKILCDSSVTTNKRTNFDFEQETKKQSIE